MVFEIINLIISILTLLGLGVYAYFTYLIAKDTYNPFVSFTLNPSPYVGPPSIIFNLTNKGKVEVEIFSKVWYKINGELFEFKDGFYGNKTSWILQPFSEGQGHFELLGMTNKKEIKLGDFVKENKISSLKFTLQIKYHKVGSKNWKKSSIQEFIYQIDTGIFWLNV